MTLLSMNDPALKRLRLPLFILAFLCVTPWFVLAQDVVLHDGALVPASEVAAKPALDADAVRQQQQILAKENREQANGLFSSAVSLFKQGQYDEARAKVTHLEPWAPGEFRAAAAPGRRVGLGVARRSPAA